MMSIPSLLMEYVISKQNKMNDVVKEICKVGQGFQCCRYLVFGSQGFECAKHTELESVLDARVDAGAMIAQGNNCAGKTIEELNPKS